MDEQNLFLMVGAISKQTSSIEEKVTKIEKVVLGNGDTGLAEQLRILQVAVANHLHESERIAQEAAKKKEKIDGKTWAIMLLVIGQIISQVVPVIRSAFLQ